MHATFLVSCLYSYHIIYIQYICMSMLRYFNVHFCNNGNGLLKFFQQEIEILRDEHRVAKQGNVGVQTELIEQSMK